MSGGEVRVLLARLLEAELNYDWSFDDPDRVFADAAAHVVSKLSKHGYSIVQLPKPDSDGEWESYPRHWVSTQGGRVFHRSGKDTLSPAAARRYASSLLAAAAAAEEDQ